MPFGPEIDSTIRIIELVVVCGAAAVVLVKLGGAVTKFEGIGEKQSLIIERQGEDIKGLRVDFGSLRSVVIDMVVEKTRIDTHAMRLTVLERLIDELRRGEGYILPLTRSAYEAPPRKD